MMLNNMIGRFVRLIFLSLNFVAFSLLSVAQDTSFVQAEKYTVVVGVGDEFWQLNTETGERSPIDDRLLFSNQEMDCQLIKLDKCHYLYDGTTNMLYTIHGEFERLYEGSFQIYQTSLSTDEIQLVYEAYNFISMAFHPFRENYLIVRHFIGDPRHGRRDYCLLEPNTQQCDAIDPTIKNYMVGGNPSQGPLIWVGKNTFLSDQYLIDVERGLIHQVFDPDKLIPVRATYMTTQDAVLVVTYSTDTPYSPLANGDFRKIDLNTLRISDSLGQTTPFYRDRRTFGSLTLSFDDRYILYFPTGENGRHSVVFDLDTSEEVLTIENSDFKWLPNTHLLIGQISVENGLWEFVQVNVGTGEITHFFESDERIRYFVME